MKRIYFLLYLLTIFFIYGQIPDTESTEYRQSRYTHFEGLSTDSKSTLTARDVGSTWHEEDTGKDWIWDSTAWVVSLKSAYTVGDSTGASLAATGITDVICVRGYNIAGFYFEITKINTSATIGLQSKTGTSGWTYHDIDPTTYTSNGNEGLVSSNLAFVDSLRMNFSAESGGGDVIITNVVSTRGKQ